MWEHFLGDEKDMFEIVVHLAVPNLFVHIHGPTGCRAPDIVMEDIDSPKFCDARCNHFLDLIRLGDVTTIGNAGIAFLLNCLARFLYSFFIEVSGKDLCPFSGE